jgi:hypothetical protein
VAVNHSVAGSSPARGAKINRPSCRRTVFEVKLKGQNGYQNTQFTEENISNINKFYHQYVLNQIPAADDNMTVYEEK